MKDFISGYASIHFENIFHLWYIIACFVFVKNCHKKFWWIETNISVINIFWETANHVWKYFDLQYFILYI